MTIYLGKVTEANDYLNKSFDRALELTGYLKEESSMLNGDFIVEAPVSQFKDYNYCEIPSLGRWYYITDVVSVSARLTQIHIRVDVLNTYASQIVNCYGVVTRNEHLYSPLLPDGERFIQSNPIITTTSFSKPSTADDNTYVLLTTGES